MERIKISFSELVDIWHNTEDIYLNQCSEKEHDRRMNLLEKINLHIDAKDFVRLAVTCVLGDDLKNKIIESEE